MVLEKFSLHVLMFLLRRFVYCWRCKPTGLFAGFIRPGWGTELNLAKLKLPQQLANW